MEQGEPGEAGSDENCFNPNMFTLKNKWIIKKALLGEGWDYHFQGENGPVMLILRVSVARIYKKYLIKMLWRATA